MRKMGWAYGLAAASMVFVGSHALAAGESSDSSSSMGSGSSTGSGSSSGSSMGSSDTSMGTGSSMGSSSSASGKQLHGKVQNFDRSSNTLTLSNSDKTLKVDPSTKIMKNGERATLDDIKEGDDVRASYSGSGDTLVVRTIEILPMSSAPSGAGTGAAPSDKGTSPSDTSTPPSGTGTQQQGGGSSSKSY